MKNENIRLFAKFGKREHLEQITNGKIRFTPTIQYIKIEEEQKNKGQGDKNEGLLHFIPQKLNINGKDYDISKKKINFKVQGVNNIPVLCLMALSAESFENNNDNKYLIELKEDIKETIKRDFTNADTVLLILEPKKLITEIEKICQCKHELVNYYDFKENSFSYYNYLTSVNSDTTGKMQEDDIYKHLLCKDSYFKSQNEYRIIKMDEKIDNAISIDFNFNSKYKLLPIENILKQFKFTNKDWRIINDNSTIL